MKTKEIAEQVLKLFMRCGIKSITMDDVARELHMSKKTLYQYFTDKDDLVKKTMEYDCKRDQCVFELIHENAKNAIDELFDVNDHLRKIIGNIHPSILFDLQKYHPSAWQIFENHKQTYILSSVKRNIERGISEDFYNVDVKVDITARIYISKIDAMFNVNIFPAEEYNIIEIHKELILYHMRSIATSKGLKYLEKKLKQ